MGRFRILWSRIYTQLSAPTVADLDWPSDAAENDVLAAITGAPAGATLSIVSAGSRIATSGTNIIKSTVPFAGNGTFYIRVSHPEAPPSQQPHVDFGPYSYVLAYPPAYAALTFDSAKTGSYITLSNGDLTATANLGTSSNYSTAMANGTLEEGQKGRIEFYPGDYGNASRYGGLLSGAVLDGGEPGNSTDAGMWLPGNSGGVWRYNGAETAAAPNGINKWYGFEYDLTTLPGVCYIVRDDEVRLGPFNLPNGFVRPGVYMRSQVGLAVTMYPGGATGTYTDADGVKWNTKPTAGFPAINGPATGGGIITVSTLAALQAALASGATIELTADIGQLDIVNQDFLPAVTIRSSDPAVQRKIAGLFIYNSSGIRLQGFNFNEMRGPVGANNPLTSGEITTVQYSEDVVFTDCLFKWQSAEDTEPQFGVTVYAPISAYIRNSTSIYHVHCEFRWVGGGIAWAQCTDVKSLDNWFHHNFSDDAHNVSRCFDVIVDNALVGDLHLLTDNDANPNHADVVQTQTVGDTQGYGPITVTNCRVYLGSPTASGHLPDHYQGIFLSSETSYKKLGITVTGNTLVGLQTNAITTVQSLWAIVTGNTVIGFKDVPGKAAGNYRTTLNYGDIDDLTLSNNSAPEETNNGNVTFHAGSEAVNITSYVTYYYGLPPGWSWT